MRKVAPRFAVVLRVELEPDFKDFDNFFAAIDFVNPGVKSHIIFPDKLNCAHLRVFRRLEVGHVNFKGGDVRQLSDQLFIFH